MKYAKGANPIFKQGRLVWLIEKMMMLMIQNGDPLKSNSAQKFE